MGATEWLRVAAAEEFAGAELGDPRRTRRLCEIAERVERDPAASFPGIFGSSSELEGFYRFLRNDNFGWEDVLEPHLEASCSRAAAVGECLAIHDTTEFAFRGEREGLGRTSSTAQGYFGHLTLLVATDEARTPLGVAALEQYSRTKRRGRSRVLDRRDDAKSEGRRWLRGATAVEQRAAGRFDCIHVADREGDTFPFLSGLLDLGARFVVRVSQDRRVEDEDGEAVLLHQQVLEMQPTASFDIDISSRGKRLNPTMARSHPSRNERTAHVSMASMTVTINAPGSRRKTAPIEVNLVRVWEAHPPPGEPRVEWLLWTTEPVATAAQMRKVIDHYRARWVIEEYFKALKTGCQFERRQLESFDTLSTALAVFAPVAWKLLLIRSVARNHPNSKATEILSPIQVEYLEKKYGRRLQTASDALQAVARLGGHLRQNGEPGWQTLGRGYEKLAAGEAFLHVLGRPPTCDQS